MTRDGLSIRETHLYHAQHDCNILRVTLGHFLILCEHCLAPLHTHSVSFSWYGSSTLFPLNCRLLIYGIYCSQVEIAIAVLDLICKEKEDVRLKLEVRHLKSVLSLKHVQYTPSCAQIRSSFLVPPSV